MAKRASGDIPSYEARKLDMSQPVRYVVTELDRVVTAKVMALSVHDLLMRYQHANGGDLNRVRLTEVGDPEHYLVLDACKQLQEENPGIFIFDGTVVALRADAALATLRWRGKPIHILEPGDPIVVDDSALVPLDVAKFQAPQPPKRRPGRPRKEPVKEIGSATQVCTICLEEKPKTAEVFGSRRGEVRGGSCKFCRNKIDIVQHKEGRGSKGSRGNWSDPAFLRGVRAMLEQALWEETSGPDKGCNIKLPAPLAEYLIKVVDTKMQQLGTE